MRAVFGAGTPAFGSCAGLQAATGAARGQRAPERAQSGGGVRAADHADRCWTRAPADGSRAQSRQCASKLRKHDAVSVLAATDGEQARSRIESNTLG